MSSFYPAVLIRDFRATSEELQLLEVFENYAAKQTVQEEALIYITGYVAHRFRHRYPHLGVPTHTLIPSGDWLSCISRGNCIQPSKNFENVAKIMNAEFLAFHGNGLSREPLIFDKVTDLVSEKINNSLPRNVLACLIRTRTYIRLRYMNLEIKRKNTVKKVGKKTKHICNKVYI